MFTWTPFTFGILLVPVVVLRYPELDFTMKLLGGTIYMMSSFLFPSFAFRAVSNNALQVWITPTRDRLIVEKRSFWFGLFTEEYIIQYLRPLYARGMDRHCWFECKKTKRKILLKNELLDHPVWFELLGIKQRDISNTKHQLLFTERNNSSNYNSL